MTAQEVTEWAAYEQVTGPLGQERDDRLATMTAFYVVSALGAKEASLSKMLPQWASKRPEGWQSIKTKLMSLTRASGGEVKS